MKWKTYKDTEGNEHRRPIPETRAEYEALLKKNRWEDIDLADSLSAQKGLILREERLPRQA